MGKSSKKRAQAKHEQERLKNKSNATDQPSARNKSCYRWQARDTHERTYINSANKTDFDIPVFSYKSAFIILLSTFAAILIIPWVCSLLKVDYRLPTVVLGALISGFSVATTQFFCERTTGFCKTYFLVGTVISFVVAVLLFMVIYLGVLV